MAFDAHDRQIGEILNRAVFDIPRNQRRYVWSRNNWKELLDDIIFSCGSNTTFHFWEVLFWKIRENKWFRLLYHY